MQLAFFTPRVIPIKNQFPPPISITIHAVEMSLPIQETAFSHNTWEVASDAISHLSISARPQEKGPIILYGHNTNNRFGPIRWLLQGDTIVITTADKKSYTYRVTKTERVNPDNITELTNVSQEMLVLYTCDGFADLQRFLVFARPQ